MGSHQDGQAARDRRRCRICNQLKPISEYSLKNGRPRAVCKPCRAIRKFRQQQREHRQTVAGLIRELVRLSRGDRLRSPKACDVLGELIGVCGNVDTAVAIWAAQLKEALRTGRRPKAVLGQFELVVDMLRSERPPPKEAISKRERRPKLPDISTWSDAQLQEAISRHEEQRL